MYKHTELHRAYLDGKLPTGFHLVLDDLVCIPVTLLHFPQLRYMGLCGIPRDIQQDEGIIRNNDRRAIPSFWRAATSRMSTVQIRFRELSQMFIGKTLATVYSAWDTCQLRRWVSRSYYYWPNRCLIDVGHINLHHSAFTSSSPSEDTSSRIPRPLRGNIENYDGKNRKNIRLLHSSLHT
jgi:hypothetical protein